MLKYLRWFASDRLLAAKDKLWLMVKIRFFDNGRGNIPVHNYLLALEMILATAGMPVVLLRLPYRWFCCHYCESRDPTSPTSYRKLCQHLRDYFPIWFLWYHVGCSKRRFAKCWCLLTPYKSDKWTKGAKWRNLPRPIFVAGWKTRSHPKMGNVFPLPRTKSQLYCEKQLPICNNDRITSVTY